MIDLGNLDPQEVAKVVPLCMAQYEWIFSTTRVPCAEQDRLVHYEADESRHIVAIHRGYFYKVPTHDPRTKQQYTRYQMYYAFDAILNANEPPFMTEAEAQLPVLTTMNRDEWARVRQQYFINNPLNRKMIDIIDRAAFLINLDHEDVDLTLDAAARQYFVGTGVNRWCDKSFSIVVLKDGRTGMNGEHSWGDAPAMCHVIEIAGLMDIKEHPYHEDGLVKRTAEDDAFEARGGNSTTFCAPSRLHFVVPPALIKVIDEARTEVQTRIQDVKQKVLHFKGYGKKWVSRRAAVSPDAWLQMALQLAYYRDQGHFDQTYESSMTRFFLEGRTETIRSVSHESCAVVRAFEDPNVNAEQKYKLLTAACTQHQNYTTQAMIGEGVDRHLFTLYIASVVRKVDAPFLSAALSAKWKLSTSQIPPHQNPPESYEGVDVQVKYLTPSGGFGPVSDDGYGVCYNLHDNGIFFHVSSRIAPGNTDATRLAGRIEQAMLDMRAVMEPAMPAAPAK
jgi:carnitine O-palmitoyltransferase 1